MGDGGPGRVSREPAGAAATRTGSLRLTLTPPLVNKVHAASCPALPCPALTLPCLTPTPGPLHCTAQHCRYNVYIESQAYASNLRQKMVCGSVLVALRTEYWEWYAPALVPGRDYVQVTHEEDHVCEEVGRIGGCAWVGGRWEGCAVGGWVER